MLLASIAHAAPPPRPALVILTETGQTRDGLPVLTRHPDASAVHAVLTRGFSGRLLRLYALEQEFLRRARGRTPEPAYLLLSTRQGGFPQFGFFLDGEKKADVGWVDLHRHSRLSGAFGAMDQIFPHELLHVIVRQLAGEPRESGGNQMHAIGVRTDPVNAFNEGFAEHAQVMAVDDPGAVEATRGLRSDPGPLERATRAAAAFEHDLGFGWLPVRPSQIRFLLWFSSTEQVWRYHAVKANLFARQAPIPRRLLERPDKYDAYLLHSVLPGRSDGSPKPGAAMLSTEGVMAHLFWRFVTDDALLHRYGAASLFDAFGITPQDADPVDNVYLKLFATLAADRPSTTAEFLRRYIARFPEDAEDVARLVRSALLGQDLPPEAPELWLANDALTTGTSLFDQYRGIPRTHTFDANAATAFDWIGVPGVPRDLADRLVAGAPYASLDQVRAIVPPELRPRLAAMESAMTQLRSKAESDEASLSLWAIARPYLVRLAAVLGFATAAGAWLARRLGARRWWGAAFVAFVSSTLTLGFAWFITAPAWYPLLAGPVVGGLPWALGRLVRRRGLVLVGQALLVWAAASWPAILLSGLWQSK